MPRPEQRSPNGHRWHSDHLGTAVRDGLAGLRQAEPSSRVWRRISDEIDPRPARWQPSWLVRWLGGDSEGAWRRRWISLRGATALSVAMLLVLAVGSLSVQVNIGSGVRPAVRAADGWTAGLELAELDIQPGLVERPVDLTMPPLRRTVAWVQARSGPRVRQPHEAYNRTLWLPPEPRPGPTAPLLDVVSQ